MYKTVFVSHSKFDEAIGKEIEGVIREGGYIAWRFQRDMQGGRSWPPQLPQSIELHEIFLYIATAYAQLSENCQKELQHAALLSKALVTVTTHPEWIPPFPLEDHQVVYYDGTPKTVVRLMLALQGAQPLDRDKVPGDWSRWDGTSKLELANAIKKDQDTPSTQVSRDLTVVERRDILHDAISQIQAHFENALQQLESSDSRIKFSFGTDSSSGFSSLIWLDKELLKGCRVYISADLNGITFDGNTRHALQWEVQEIRRQMRDTNSQIESNLQAVIDGDANTAAFVRSLDHQHAALRSQLQEKESMLNQLGHLSGIQDDGDSYKLRAIVGKRNGEHVLEFIPAPSIQIETHDPKICTIAEAAELLSKVFVGGLADQSPVN